MGNSIRKKPLEKVLRELYLKSGNVCAFPNCNHLIVNKDGDYISQLCHIEAAKDGGPRWNPAQTDDERRSYDNLMLMCYEHHIVTDDAITYTVEILRKMKAAHESKFESIIGKIGDEVYDTALETEPFVPKRCGLLFSIENFDFAEEEAVEAIEGLVKSLRKLSPRTRTVLLRILNRVDSSFCKVKFMEMVETISLSPEEFIIHLKLIEDQYLVSDSEDQWAPDRTIEIVSPRYLDYHPPILMFLKEACERWGIEMQKPIVDLDFSDFDKIGGG